MGFRAGENATEASQSNFMGIRTGINSTSAYNSNFLGYQAGGNATNASSSNFIGKDAGLSARNSSNSNFIGEHAGIFATDANDSNFIGTRAGATTLGETSKNSYSNFIGFNTGRNAVSASYSILMGYQAGFNQSTFTPSNSIGANNIVIGTNITLAPQQKDSINLGGIIFATGSYFDTGSNPFTGSVANARVGIGTPTPQFTLDISGSTRITNNLTVSGSVNISGSGINIGGLTTLSNDGFNLYNTNGNITFYRNQCQLQFIIGNDDVSAPIQITSDNTVGLQISSSGYLHLSASVVGINDILRLTPRSTTPGSPTNGMTIVSGSGADQHIYCYLNSTWKQLD
jgi:hypothetical protein